MLVVVAPPTVAPNDSHRPQHSRNCNRHSDRTHRERLDKHDRSVVH